MQVPSVARSKCIMGNKGKARQFQFFRDTAGGNFLNSVCRDAATKEVLYYVDFGPGKTITFHRGDKAGPVLATAEACEEKHGTSKIQLTEPETTIALEHIPRRMLVMPPKTTFTAEGKKYYWKGYTDLFDESSDKLVAQYSPVEVEGSDNKTGELLITEGVDKEIHDLAVISTIVQQQRGEARKRAGSVVN